MNIQKTRFLILLSMLLPGVSIYAAFQEKKLDTFDDSSMIFHDQVVSRDYDFNANYPLLSQGFQLIGQDFQAFMQARLVDHYPYEKTKSGVLLNDAIIDAEDVVRTQMVEKLIKGFQKSLNEERNIDQQTNAMFKFVLEYKDTLLGEQILDEFNKKIDTYGILFSAISAHKIEMVRMLIAAGIDVNTAEFYTNKFPLYYAVKSENDVIAQMLLDAGADINKKNKFGTTSLFDAIDVIGHDNYKIVKKLIALGADVNISTNTETPLIQAIIRQDAQLVQMLIAAGADVNMYSVSGGSPFSAAMMRNRKSDIVQMLVDAGVVDVNVVVSSNGETALTSTIKRAVLTNTIKRADLEEKVEAEKIVKILIAAGADINIANKKGELPLNLAYPEMKQIILQAVERQQYLDHLRDAKCTIS